MTLFKKQNCLIPSNTPLIDLKVVKDYLHIDHMEEDHILEMLVKGVSREFESFTGNAILLQQWEVIISRDKNDYIELPVKPVLDIVEVASYGNIGRWEKLKDNLWSLEGDVLYMDVLSYLSSVRVIYNAGMFRDKSELSDEMKMILLQATSYLYNHRGDAELDTDQLMRFFSRFTSLWKKLLFLPVSF